MPAAMIYVKFAAHISEERVHAMVGTFLACGDMQSDGRNYRLEVKRSSSLPYLRVTLLSWERHGFSKWSEKPA